jgi:RND family efflux transporter MFP subunit
MSESHGRPPLSVREKVALTLAGIVVLAVSGTVAWYMMTHKPRPERRKPVPTIPVVTVQEMSLSDYLVVIPVMGTVVPATEVDLKAQVGGKVIWTHPEFVEGGIVRKGQVLAKIDPVDYELSLTAKKALLETAIANLKAEQGKQEVARVEWDILGLGEDATELDTELALRRPQLAQMEASLEAAGAEVRQAELALERTVIRAPFNALVRSVSVDKGALITSQTSLASLVGTDSYYVETLIPLDRIDSIFIPDGSDDPASIASVRTGTGSVRQGRVFKLPGDVEASGRLARLFIEVKDPLSLAGENTDELPMLLGDYVSVDIEGRTIEDVFIIPRQYFKDGNLIYTVDSENHLRIKKINIVWRDAVSVVARGIEPGERLVISDLSAAVEGMSVRIQNPESRSQDPGEESGS